jgi:hypothetical protein
MNIQKSYTKEIVVLVSSEAAYRALTAEIGEWWVAPDGNASKVGDTPIFNFGPTYWKMKVKDLVPSKLVVWECIEANHVDERLAENAQREWVGTILKWEIKKIPEGTKIHFMHQGLISSLNCYKVCKEGWDYYFADSLKRYLDSGKGKPFNS